jgi:hypothetical protein
MPTNTHDRLEAAYDYLRSLLAETSTIRAIVVLVTLKAGFMASLPPDVTLTIAMSVGATLKLVLPDDLPEWLHLPKWRKGDGK